MKRIMILLVFWVVACSPFFAPVVHKIDVTGLPFEGSPDASVIIVAFSDYQGPACAELEPLLQQVLEKYPKDVKLVIKNIPLHSFSRKAAMAALAAGKQGKFWEMNERLFANQKELSDAKVETIAKEIGLNMEQFNKDLKDPTSVSLIDRDFNDGVQANIRKTPTIFINGKLLTKESLSGFQEAIEAELKKKT